MHFWGHYIMNLLENMDHELWESKNVIYCYTNKINGKRYVGQTVQKLKKRHGQHLSGKQLIDKKLKQLYYCTNQATQRRNIWILKVIYRFTNN